MPAESHRSTSLRNANTLIALSCAFALVGLASLVFPGSGDHPYLNFPHSLLYFLPLLVPLTTYITIARWTGEKHYRHS